MIFKDGKQVKTIVKSGKTILKVIQKGYVVYCYNGSEIPYLTVSKNVLWLTPTDNFDINSNTNWVITN